MKIFATVSIAIAAMMVGAGPIIAADMPIKALPPVAPAPSWTACYIGGNGGGGSIRKDYTDPLAPPAVAPLGRHTGSGAVGGGQAGCDVQFGSWVFGVQGMVDGTS